MPQTIRFVFKYHFSSFKISRIPLHLIHILLPFLLLSQVDIYPLYIVYVWFIWMIIIHLILFCIAPMPKRCPYTTSFLSWVGIYIIQRTLCNFFNKNSCEVSVFICGMHQNIIKFLLIKISCTSLCTTNDLKIQHLPNHICKHFIVTSRS